MAAEAIWHGTREESAALLEALQRNCACVFGLMGVRTSTCPPHEMLVHDQRALDGLLAYRHLSERLNLEEFTG